MRLQSGNPGLALGDADSRYLRLAGGDVVGAVTVTKAPPSVYPADATMPPAYSVIQEWANAGKTWTAVKVEVTNTASSATSKPIDVAVGGASLFSVSKDGKVTAANGFQNAIAGGGIGLGISAVDYNEIRSAGAINLVAHASDAVIIQNTSGTGGVLDLKKRSAAPAVPSNAARFFCEDNGSGKIRLMVQFPSGAAQQIAIEP